MVINNGFEANLHVKTNELIGFTKKTYPTYLYKSILQVFDFNNLKELKFEE